MVDLDNIQINPDRRQWHYPAPLECISVESEFPEYIEYREPSSFVKKANIASQPDLPKSFAYRFAPKDYKVPEHWIAKLGNARVFSHNGVIIDEKNRLIEELAHEFGDFPLGNRLCHYQGLPEPTKIEGRLLVIPTISGWKNYWHWMADALPRLRGISGNYYDYVLVPAFKSYSKNSVKICGVPTEKILWCDGASHYQADEIIAPRPTPMYCMSAASVQYIHQSYQITPSDNPHRKLYLSRGDSRRRRWLNENDIIDLLKPYGYEVILAGELSLREQAQLFSEAISIIGPHGAAMTNAIFTSSKAHLVECFSGDFIYPHFYNLAAVRGFTYHGHYSPNQDRSPDGYLNLATLQPIIEKIEQKIAGC